MMATTSTKVSIIAEAISAHQQAALTMSESIPTFQSTMSHGCDTKKDWPTSLVEPTQALQSVTRRQLRAAGCDLRACCCTCHRTYSRSWKPWTVTYTPAAAIVRPCDQDSCTARKATLGLQIQISLVGISAAFRLQGEFVTGAAGYSLRTALRIQRLVKATSKGFEILHQLRYFNTTIEEAKTAFKRLHASDPALNTHVNARGQTYLSELVRHGGWGDYGRQTENQLEIIRFLVEELGVRNGMETPQYVSLTVFPAERRGNHLTIARFLYKIADFGDNQHLEAIDFFLKIGHDFENCDDPRFELWPEPAVSLLAPPERYGGCIMPAVDPFYVEAIALIASKSPGTAESYPTRWF